MAIVEAFKTCHHNLKDCKHEVLIFMEQNNIHYFMDSKGLSFRQIYKALEVFQYHFQINYCQGKTNKASHIFFWYFQQNAKEEVTLQAKNTKALQRLQNSLTKVSGLLLQSFSFFTKLLYAIYWSLFRYTSSKTFFKYNWLIKDHILLALEKWVWNYRN